MPSIFKEIDQIFEYWFFRGEIFHHFNIKGLKSSHFIICPFLFNLSILILFFPSFSAFCHFLYDKFSKFFSDSNSFPSPLFILYNVIRTLVFHLPIFALPKSNSKSSNGKCINIFVAPSHHYLLKSMKTHVLFLVLLCSALAHE